MYCGKCGTQISNDSNICPKCGEMIKNRRTNRFKDSNSLFDEIMTVIVFGLLVILLIIIAVPTFLYIRSTSIGTWEQPFIGFVNGANLRRSDESYFCTLGNLSSYSPAKEPTDEAAKDYQIEHDEWSVANSYYDSLLKSYQQKFGNDYHVGYEAEGVSRYTNKIILKEAEDYIEDTDNVNDVRIKKAWKIDKVKINVKGSAGKSELTLKNIYVFFTNKGYYVDTIANQSPHRLVQPSFANCFAELYAADGGKFKGGNAIEEQNTIKTQ